MNWRAALSRRGNRGVTLVEVSISSALFAAVVFAGTGASRLALDSSSASLDSQGVEMAGARVHEQIYRALQFASLGTLESVTSSEEGPVEMAEGIAYDNVRYHRAAAWRSGEVVYVPSLDSDPQVLELIDDGSPGGGRLEYDDGTTRRVLARGIESVTFTRNRRQVVVDVVLDPSDSGAPELARTQRSIVIRAR